MSNSLRIERASGAITYTVRRMRDRKALPKGMQPRYYTLGQALRAVFEYIEPYSTFAIFEVAPGQPSDSPGALVAEIRAAAIVPRWTRGLGRRPKKRRLPEMYVTPDRWGGRS